MSRSVDIPGRYSSGYVERDEEDEETVNREEKRIGEDRGILKEGRASITQIISNREI